LESLTLYWKEIKQDTMISRSTGKTSSDVQIVMYSGIYSKSCVREHGHPLDGCVGDLGPGKIPEFATLILLLLPAILSLMFLRLPPLEDTGDGNNARPG
jgi:hypothetical protein